MDAGCVLEPPPIGECPLGRVGKPPLGITELRAGPFATVCVFFDRL